MFIQQYNISSSSQENTDINIVTVKGKLLPPHWVNYNYEDIQGEIWKELPGLDDYFLISNFGRLKSLDRHIYCKNGSTRFCKGRIYKGFLIKYKNKTIGDYTEELKVGFFYQNKNYNFRIARTVYNFFVKELNFDKDKLMVAHKDGNRLNNSVSNLYLQTISEKQKTITTSNRGHKLSALQTKEGHSKSAISRHKPITQFSLQGIPIKSYKSIKEAALETGVDNSNIVAAIKQIKMVSAGGFLWQYGIITHKIDTSFYTEFIKKSKQVRGIPVVQINGIFEVVAVYDSIKQACQKTNISSNEISQCLKNKKIMAGGYYWQNIEQ